MRVPKIVWFYLTFPVLAAGLSRALPPSGDEAQRPLSPLLVPHAPRIPQPQPQTGAQREQAIQGYRAQEKFYTTVMHKPAIAALCRVQIERLENEREKKPTQQVNSATCDSKPSGGSTPRPTLKAMP
jgi:hypothetical protein